jgi:hypothetical protein
MTKRLALYAVVLPALTLLASACARDLSVRSVSSDGAVLSAKVDWKPGMDLRYWWEASANGGGWARVSAVRDPGPFRVAARNVPITDRVTGLRPGTSYHYRLCADLQAPRSARNVCFAARSSFATASASATPPFFRGDFDTGSVSQFSNVQCRPGRLTVVGGQARFEVREGDREPQTGHEGRCEGIPGEDVRDGSEVWQRFSVTFAPGFRTNSWLSFSQWHANGGGGQSPFAYMVEARSNRLILTHGSGSPRYWTGPILQPGHRYDFVSHVRFSDSPSTGFVELWLDGRRQTMQGGGLRAYGPTSDPCVRPGCPSPDPSGGVYPKFGSTAARPIPTPSCSTATTSCSATERAASASIREAARPTGF